MIAWGGILNKMLSKARISQSELARHLCVSPQYIANIIIGERNPPNRIKLIKAWDLIESKVKTTKKEKYEFFIFALRGRMNKEDLRLSKYIDRLKWDFRKNLFYDHLPSKDS
jgi:transcriptional regulator with XRE-family HTH domain